MKKLLQLIVIVLISSQSYAQSSLLTQAEHCKYWQLRARLRNHFVAVGFEDKDSKSITSIYGIPAGAKKLVIDPLDRYTENDSTTREITSYTANYQGSLNTSYELVWGDGVEQLAWYIGILATEYKLLNEKNTSEITKNLTLYELFCAFKALDRLERKASSINYGMNLEHREGIFLRDDITPYVSRPNSPSNYDPIKKRFKEHNAVVKRDGYDPSNNLELVRSYDFLNTIYMTDLRKRIPLSIIKNGSKLTDLNELIFKLYDQSNNTDPFPIINQGIQNRTNADAYRSDWWSGPSGYYFSPDHCVHLIMALTLVRKYGPASGYHPIKDKFNNQCKYDDNTMITFNFQYETEQIARRMQNTLHNSGYLPKIPFTNDKYLELFKNDGLEFRYDPTQAKLSCLASKMTNEPNSFMFGHMFSCGILEFQGPLSGAKPLAFYIANSLNRVIRNEYKEEFIDCGTGADCSSYPYGYSHFLVRLMMEVSPKWPFTDIFKGQLPDFSKSFISLSIANSGNVFKGCHYSASKTGSTRGGLGFFWPADSEYLIDSRCSNFLLESGDQLSLKNRTHHVPARWFGVPGLNYLILPAYWATEYAANSNFSLHRYGSAHEREWCLGNMDWFCHSDLYFSFKWKYANPDENPNYLTRDMLDDFAGHVIKTPTSNFFRLFQSLIIEDPKSGSLALGNSEYSAIVNVLKTLKNYPTNSLDRKLPRYRPSINSTNRDGWRTSMAFVKFQKFYFGDDNEVDEYNGVDYMLAYNLIRLYNLKYSVSEYTPYENLAVILDSKIKQNNPDIHSYDQWSPTPITAYTDDQVINTSQRITFEGAAYLKSSTETSASSSTPLQLYHYIRTNNSNESSSTSGGILLKSSYVDDGFELNSTLCVSTIDRSYVSSNTTADSEIQPQTYSSSRTQKSELPSQRLLPYASLTENNDGSISDFITKYSVSTHEKKSDTKSFYLKTNPVKNTADFMCNFNPLAEVSGIKIYTSSGQFVELETSITNNQVVINTSNLTPGIYKVVFITNSKIYVKSFIK